MDGPRNLRVRPNQVTVNVARFLSGVQIAHALEFAALRALWRTTAFLPGMYGIRAVYSVSEPDRTGCAVRAEFAELRPVQRQQSVSYVPRSQTSVASRRLTTAIVAVPTSAFP